MSEDETKGIAKKNKADEEAAEIVGVCGSQYSFSHLLKIYKTQTINDMSYLSLPRMNVGLSLLVRVKSK